MAVLMIAEIVSNGMLSLPSSLAVVGVVPGVIVILFLGIFATFTSWLLIQFKLRHPQGEMPLPPLLTCWQGVMLTSEQSIPWETPECSSSALSAGTCSQLGL